VPDATVAMNALHGVFVGGAAAHDVVDEVTMAA
jgi:hypothetical protein